jgi:transcription termination factor Rho
MDEGIFEEFKGTGNMEVRLDRQLSGAVPRHQRRCSSTRKEELLLPTEEPDRSCAACSTRSTRAALELLTDKIAPRSPTSSS